MESNACERRCAMEDLELANTNVKLLPLEALHMGRRDREQLRALRSRVGY